MRSIFTFIISLFITVLATAQIGNYNQFPAMPPAHILDDDNLTQDISFAYSLRLLRSDYEGPLIRLRRASDNAEQDFFCADDDRVDLEAINTFRGASNVFVTVWYDQSILDVDASQTILDRQPQFIPDATNPYFVGDGSNDILLVDQTVQQVTNNGAEGTVIGVFWASDRADTAFGGAGGCTNRWITHMNWSLSRLFFDPGYCGPTRVVTNRVQSAAFPNDRLEAWGQYTLARRDVPSSTVNDRIIFKIQGVLRANAAIAANRSYTRPNRRFGICAATETTTGNGVNHATTRFQEMIMYKIGIPDTNIVELEENQIAFWNL